MKKLMHISGIFLISFCASAQQVLVNTEQNRQDTWIERRDGTPVNVSWGQPDLLKKGEYRHAFGELDLDRDGFIIPSDIPEGHAIELEWHLLDTNQDGRISRDEYRAWVDG